MPKPSWYARFGISKVRRPRPNPKVVTNDMLCRRIDVVRDHFRKKRVS